MSQLSAQAADAGSGWATYRIADGESEQTSSPSYCTNALADLPGGVAGLYGPGATQRFSFDLAPTEVRWVLRSRGPDVGIEIYKFPDTLESFGAPDEQGELSWNSVQPRSTLSHVVMEAAQTVLRVHGEEGYRKRWVQHPFPAGELRDLHRLHMESDTCDLPHGALLP